jgi:putative Mg2+ transporter-C (MgtC) family protein
MDINILNELEILYYVIPKILIATVCGFLVGWEREMKNKVAGIRTIVLICVGSTIFTLASFMVGDIMMLIQQESYQQLLLVLAF